MSAKLSTLIRHGYNIGSAIMHGILLFTSARSSTGAVAPALRNPGAATSISHALDIYGFLVIKSWTLNRGAHTDIN